MSLSEQLVALGLRATSEQLQDLVARAAEKRWSPTQLLEHVTTLELEDRTKRSLDRRLRRSRLGRFKPMTDFDWAWPKRADRDQIEACLRLDFLADDRNVVLVAPHGLGKTMIAKNIAYQAILAGRSVVFTSASQILLDLAGQESARGLDRRLRYYASIGLLIIDELGYLSYDARNADLLFQLVNRRYEKKSLVLTTNLAFKDWPGVFPNATSATALIDRVIHHSEIIVLDGQSYRKREAEEDAKARQPTPEKKPASSPNLRASS